MNLKEQMMNEYQKKDSEKIKDAIAEAMKIGKKEVLYGKDVVTEDIRKEFHDGGFTVEDYEDKHSIDAKIELVRFSW